MSKISKIIKTALKETINIISYPIGILLVGAAAAMAFLAIIPLIIITIIIFILTQIFDDMSVSVKRKGKVVGRLKGFHYTREEKSDKET